MVPLSEDTIASPFSSLFSVMRDHLRLHRHVGARAALFHQLVPALHALLRFLEKLWSVLRLDQRKQSLQHGAAIAHQADVDRMPQADAGGVDIDLDGFGLPGFG